MSRGRIVNKQLHYEILKRKQTERSIQDALEYAQGIVDTVREPLIILDANFKIISASRSFYEIFKVKSGAAENRYIYDLENRQWDIPKLRELLEEILPKNISIDNFEVEHDFNYIGKRIMLLNARRIFRKANHTELILLAIEDLTDRRRIEESLREAMKINTAFISIVSHELRTPLAFIKQGVTVVLDKINGDVNEAQEKCLKIVINNVDRLVCLINEVINFQELDSENKSFTTENTDMNRLVMELKKTMKS